MAAALLGATGASTIAYQLRDQVAYAPEPAAARPQAETDSEIFLQHFNACLDAGREPIVEFEGPAVVFQCPVQLENLGVLPVVKRRITPARQPLRVAIRSSREREAEDLVGPLTPTHRNRTGAPSGSPGRAGAGVEGGR